MLRNNVASCLIASCKQNLPSTTWVTDFIWLLIGLTFTSRSCMDHYMFLRLRLLSLPVCGELLKTDSESDLPSCLVWPWLFIQDASTLVPIISSLDTVWSHLSAFLCACVNNFILKYQTCWPTLLSTIMAPNPNKGNALVLIRVT